MARVLAAVLVTVSVLLISGSVATSAPTIRRPVAVIALVDEPPAEVLTDQLGVALVNHRELAPLASGGLVGALIGPFVDEYREFIARAEDARALAERELGNFSFPVAVATAERGHLELHKVVPSTHAVALYSDLALAIAKARLGESRQLDAARFFGLAHQLTPGRRLDPTLHLPEVVAAYEAARTGPFLQGTLVVKGSGRLWIDGKDHGAAGRPVPLAAGLHVVWLTGFDRVTKGAQVIVEPSRENVLDLGDAPADQVLRVERARIALRNAPDASSRAAAMRLIAELVGVRDAVIVTMPAGKLIVQTWHDRTEGDLIGGFSAHRLVEGERIDELLRPLAPPPRPERDPRLVRTHVDGARRWHQRPIVRASLVAGVVGAIASSMLLARELSDRTVSFGGGLGFIGTEDRP